MVSQAVIRVFAVTKSLGGKPRTKIMDLRESERSIRFCRGQCTFPFVKAAVMAK